MLDFLEELTKQLKSIEPEAYHVTNTSSEAVYPYLTYSVDGEFLDRNADGITLEIDIFDNDSSYLNIYDLEKKLIERFRMARILTADFFAMFEYQHSSTIPTGNISIKRRNVVFYVRAEWRK